MGTERTFQEMLFKTEHSELTDWICRERERAEPEIKLRFLAQVAEQMKCLLKERGSQERWQVQSQAMGVGVRAQPPQQS